VNAASRLSRSSAFGVAAPVALLGAVAATIRLPFLGTIGPDEGGYAYVAREWARGDHLYRGAWIDRPQGLVLVYRLLVSVGHTAATIRLAAVVAGVVITLLLVVIGRLLESPAAGFAAALVYAVVGVGPHIEGYTFNGELAAAVPATAAVAAAAMATSSRRNGRWLVLAGALGGCAILMKQSGFDGLAVACFAAVAVPPSRRERLRGLVLVVAGAAAPLLASLAAGWLGGWHAYWSAVAGYRLREVSAAGRADHLAQSLPGAARDLAPLAIVAALAVWRRPPALAVVWLAAALAGFNLGGSYWPHYYAQLVPPLALLAGIGIARIERRSARLVAAAVVTAPVLLFVAQLSGASERHGDATVKYAIAFENDQRLARYVRAHTTAADTVYAFVSRADFYFLADREAASPYLWANPLKEIPGAIASLERTLAGPRRPKLVVVFQCPASPLLGRRIEPILRRHYQLVWRAPRTGTAVLAARTGTLSPAGRDSCGRPRATQHPS
jgi:4-amino-4-deoxy-L-arabinose transferase-like glycosyltransferase